MDWLTPLMTWVLCGFLGLAGYYRKFIKAYDIITAPLRTLLEKDGFSWSPVAQTTFDALKTTPIVVPILQLSDFSVQFIVECDTSGMGLGVVLHQGSDAIDFFSQPFAAHHHSLAAYECELIGLVHVVRHRRPYLWGQPDHYSLKFLLDQRLATIPQHHWVSKLLGFDFSVEYRLGRLNAVADALSHCDTIVAASYAISVSHFDLFDAIRSTATSDPTMTALRDQINQGDLSTPWTVVDGLVLFNLHIYIPTVFSLLGDILAATHDVAHEGVQKTLHRLCYDFHLPQARSMIQDYVQARVTCQRNKTEHLHPMGQLQSLSIPSRVWDDIGIDFIEGLPRVGDKSVILIVVDRFSKYTHFIPLGHPYLAESVAHAFFLDIVHLHGIPISIVSNRDPVFTSAFWWALFQASGFKLHMSSAFHP